MVGHRLARHAREQRGELGLALGRPAVEQLGQALARAATRRSSASRPVGGERDAPPPALRRSRARAARRCGPPPAPGRPQCAAAIANGVGRRSPRPTRARTQHCRAVELDAGHAAQSRSRIRRRVSRRASVESARSISGSGSACLGAAKASPTPVASTVRRSGFSGSSHGEHEGERRDRCAHEEDRRQRIGVGGDEGERSARAPAERRSRAVTRPRRGGRQAAGSARARRPSRLEKIAPQMATPKRAADRAEEGRARRWPRRGRGSRRRSGPRGRAPASRGRARGRG